MESRIKDLIISLNVDAIPADNAAGISADPAVTAFRQSFAEQMSAGNFKKHAGAASLKAGTDLEVLFTDIAFAIAAATSVYRNLSQRCSDGDSCSDGDKSELSQVQKHILVDLWGAQEALLAALGFLIAEVSGSADMRAEYLLSRAEAVRKRTWDMLVSVIAWIAGEGQLARYAPIMDFALNPLKDNNFKELSNLAASYLESF